MEMVAVTEQGNWHLPAAMPELAPGMVHLWRAYCAATPFDARACAACVTHGEQARASRLATPELQRRFLQAHALLHQLLAGYTHAATLPCELAYRDFGKPYLVSPQQEPPLEFSLSHAGEVVVIALARGAAVGVDVEVICPLDDLDGMLRMTCSPREQAYLATLAPDERLRGFYRMWTRKEACLKLDGVGIAGNVINNGGTGLGIETLDVLEDPPGVQLYEFRYTPTSLMGEAGAATADCVGALALPSTAGMSVDVFEAFGK